MSYLEFIKALLNKGNYFSLFLFIAGVISLIFSCITITKTSFSVFEISKNGIKLVKPSTPWISQKQVAHIIRQTVTFVGDKKETLIDDIKGIKTRYFKQSQDFANNSIKSVLHEIDEDYRITYLSKYKRDSFKCVADALEEMPTREQIEKKDLDINECPCDPICNRGCGSGLYFFSAKLAQDSEPIILAVFDLIEKNHLINREDREYEEEITVKAEELVNNLVCKVISYPIPIDNEICKTVIIKHRAKLKDAIADSLRRSRTLSLAKREAIDIEKKKYTTDLKDNLLTTIGLTNQGALQEALQELDLKFIKDE